MSAPVPSPFAHNLGSTDHRLDQYCLIERAVRDAFETRLKEELQQAGFAGLPTLPRNPSGAYERADLQASWRAFRRGFYIGAQWAEVGA